MQVRNLAKTMLIGVATLASASALAFDFDGVYVLGGVGYAGVNNADFTDESNENFGGALFGNPENLEADANFAWRGGLGVWLTDNFAVEFNYFGIANMNEDGSSFTFEDEELEDFITIQDELHVKDMWFLDLSGLGRCDFTENFWGFARLGVAYAMVERTIHRNVDVDDVEGEDFNFAFDVAKEDEGGWGASLGIGAQYDVTEMFGVRVEASTIQALNDNDMYAVTGNLVVNFGELM